MIPKTDENLLTDFEYANLSSNTYKLDIQNDCIKGYCDGLLAIKQAIYKILNTERYENNIYSWNYGIELKSLYGKQIPYAISELKRRIKEALIQDDRINNVDNFEFKTDDEKILVKFIVHTNLGNIDYEMEASV